MTDPALPIGVSKDAPFLPPPERHLQVLILGTCFPALKWLLFQPESFCWKVLLGRAHILAIYS